jgi:hypothetical protein
VIKAEYKFTLPVSTMEAFYLLSDPAREPEWRTVCVEAKLLNGKAKAGCRYEITFKLVGRLIKFTAEILTFEPGVRSEVKTLDGPFGYFGRFGYTEIQDRVTQIHWQFDVDPGDYFAIIPHSLVGKTLVADVKRDSARLAARLGGQRVAPDTREDS